MKRTGLVICMVSMIGACARSDDTASESGDTAGVVDVVARGLTLQAPDEIPSGWTTFRFLNESPMVHFVLVERIPDGQGIESQQGEIAPVFQDGMDLLSAGDVEAALERFQDLPEWFGEIVFLGGPGLTAPGRTSAATVYLEPGTYLLECYVKTGGIFHSFNPDPSVYGMVHEFTVTEETSETPEPSATVQISISTGGGIEVSGTLVPGEQTVSVRFVDQTVHENFVGHDVHLARVTGDTDLEELERWMDWSQPTGLQTPAPAVFVGGTNEMPAGATAYFTVSVEPGDYAWIAEVPGAAQKGLLKRFSVQSGDS